jgi:hypothetical protein
MKKFIDGIARSQLYLCFQKEYTVIFVSIFLYFFLYYSKLLLYIAIQKKKENNMYILFYSRDELYR